MKTYNPKLNPFETNESGLTLLHWAANGGKHEAIDRLVKTYGLKIDVLDNMNRTPLILAAARCKAATAKKLLSLFADPFLTEYLGKTAEDFANDSANSYTKRLFDKKTPKNRIDSLKALEKACLDTAYAVKVSKTVEPAYYDLNTHEQLGN